MTSMKFIILVSIFLYYFSFTLATKPSPCTTSQCTTSTSSISSLVIRLNNSDSSYKTLIKFPHGGVFAVQNIDYVNQEITLFDPYECKCLSKKLISLNLKGSPFEIDDEQSQDFWVYNCTGSSSNYSSYEYDNYLSIDLCLSGLDYTVVGTTRDNSSVLQRCHKVEKVKILGRILYGYPTSVVISWKSSICRMFHSQVKESTSLDSRSPNHKGSKILKAAILMLGAVTFTALLALLCRMIYHHSPSPRTGPDDIHRPRRAHYQLDPLTESEDNCQVSEHVGIGYISPKANHGPLLHHYEPSPRFPYRPRVEWILVGPRPPHETDRHQIVEDEDNCQVLESVGLSSSFNRDDYQANRLIFYRYEPSPTSSYRTARSSVSDSPSPSPPPLIGQFLEDAEDNCQVLESVALSGRA